VNEVSVDVVWVTVNVVWYVEVEVTLVMNRKLTETVVSVLVIVVS
jgi:hypothetical protein